MFWFLSFIAFIALGLLVDYVRPRRWEFRRRSTDPYRVAYSLKAMMLKMMPNVQYEVIAPAQPIVVRLWRILRPIKFTEGTCLEVK